MQRFEALVRGRGVRGSGAGAGAQLRAPLHPRGGDGRGRGGGHRQQGLPALLHTAALPLTLQVMGRALLPHPTYLRRIIEE